MTRIRVNPGLLTWARERAGLDTLALAGRFPKLTEWEAGSCNPPCGNSKTSPVRCMWRWAICSCRRRHKGKPCFRMPSFRMLSVRKTSTFYEAARELGVML